jgi:excinuclease ABC subunit A
LSAPMMKKEEYFHYQNIALQEFYKDLAVDTIQWHEEVKNVIYVDQTSIWKTPRSCPATFIGTFDHIRQLFAGVTESKYLWFTAWHFSFNSAKWACPACDGYGYKKVELQFLPDTYIPCELCNGKRYKTEILNIKRKGKSISEILDMYIDDALELFKEIDHVKSELQLMVDIWLGYLRMGQPAHTLSGWESQRLKLVKHLLKSYKWHSIYFLDEPTVGLHFSDIEKLLRVIKEFLDKWDTILMIEHDQNILKYADEVIRLDNGKLM